MLLAYFVSVNCLSLLWRCAHEDMAHSASLHAKQWALKHGLKPLLKYKPPCQGEIGQHASNRAQKYRYDGLSGTKMARSD